MTEYYNKIANSYNELYGKEQINKAKIILKEILKKKTSGNLLDIGGGTGISTKIFTNNFNCTLIDPANELTKQAQKNIKTIIGKSEELPFKENTFDIIISLTALHHTDLKQALNEIKRVSKEDSLIAISFLKKSKKLKGFKQLFNPKREIEEDKDMIFLNF